MKFKTEEASNIEKLESLEQKEFWLQTLKGVVDIRLQAKVLAHYGLDEKSCINTLISYAKDHEKNKGKNAIANKAHVTIDTMEILRKTGEKFTIGLDSDAHNATDFKHADVTLEDYEVINMNERQI